MKALVERVKPWLLIALSALALWLLWLKLRQYTWAEVQQSLAQITPWRLGVSAVLAAFSYFILIGTDILALRSIGRRLPLKDVIYVSLLGSVSSFNFGTLVGGTSVRYHLYSRRGLTGLEVIQVTLLLGLSFWIGFFALAGVVFTAVDEPIKQFTLAPHEHRVAEANPEHQEQEGHAAGNELKNSPQEAQPPHNKPKHLTLLPASSSRPVGIVLLLLTLGYVGLSATRWQPWKYWGSSLRLPDTFTTLGQLGISSLDFLGAAACLYILVSDGQGMTYFDFLRIVLLANLAMVITHVPGGVGVFEYVVLELVENYPIPHVDVFAGLLVFRIVYYLLPLAIAMLYVGGCYLVRYGRRSVL